MPVYVIRSGRVLLLSVLAIGAALAQPQPPVHSHDEESETPSGPRSSVRREAEWAPWLLLERRADLLPQARRALQQPDPVIRRRGLFLLGCTLLPQAGPDAAGSLRDADVQVRMQAGVTLAMLQQSSGLTAAAEALKRGPQWLRPDAVYGLWRLDTRRAREALSGARPYLSGVTLALANSALAQRRPQPESRDVTQPLPALPASLHELWQDVADVFVYESDLWWHKGNYDQAIRCTETAIFYDPGYVDLYSNVAWLQWSMGRHGEAISTYRRAIAANPKSWEAHQNLADYYWGHNQRQVALAHLQQAADLGSPTIQRRRLGHAYRELGHADKAKAVWQEILKRDPNDPIAKRELERARQ